MPEPGRLRELVFSMVVRPLLFFFWVLVLWGTLVAAAAGWMALTAGPRAAVDALLAPARVHPLGGVNFAAAVLALAVWTVVATLAGRARKDR